jgi:hypothetical protein
MLVAITGPWPQTPQASQALEARPARARPVT